MIIHQKTTRDARPIVEMEDGFQDRASGGEIDVLSCASDSICRSASSSKKRGWPSAALLPFIPFLTSHARSCLVDRRAMPPLTTARVPDGEQRKRLEKTPLTPLTPCEAHSFWDTTMSVQPIGATSCPSLQVDEAPATDPWIGLSILI